ncbi:MAG: L,D-transpeptidase family protein [Gammaproteobacteria bacterium (ex Lamellibrachia satsuma)]|nr:MAG: L,D-transpeptidase family protein [Gammaproteobacteria bacterium (ex Lamellibrachia satsuma)]
MEKSHNYISTIIGLFCVTLWCGTVNSASLEDELRGVAAIRERLQAVLQDVEVAIPAREPNWMLLQAFYEDRKGRAVWHESEHLNAQGETLLTLLGNALTEGLEPVDYHFSRLKASRLLRDPAVVLERELLLTDAFFRYAGDLRGGRVKAADLDPLWHFNFDRAEPMELLQAALSADGLSDLLGDLAPGALEYKRLRQVLYEYHEIESKGGWKPFPAVQILRPGDRHPSILLLRERLRIEGDYLEPLADGDDYFNPPLEAAVRRFQQRHGLDVDGRVGPKTRAELNVSVGHRLAQIKANMERWRWLPHSLEERYLLVNTAGFEVTMRDQGAEVFHRRTVGGKLERETPSFKSRITHLVLNPQWTVPRRIAVEDLLPKQLRDDNFFDSKGIAVFRKGEEGGWIQEDAAAIDWSLYHKNDFPFVLRQMPGPRNSLGQIKFHMVSPYAVFLHDTPAKGLFEQPTRPFSSGCVRVESASLLATQLLQGESEQASALALQEGIDSGQTMIWRLKQPIPVYLAYFSAWANEDGIPQFRADVYGLDAPLIQALASGGNKLSSLSVAGLPLSSDSVTR